MPRENIRPRTGARRIPKFTTRIPKFTNSTPKITKQSNVTDNFQVNIYLWVTRILLGSTIHIIELILYFELLLMVLTCSFIKYPIKITSILGIYKLNSIIPPMYAEMMGRFLHIRKGNESQCLKYLPKQDFARKHYTLSVRCMYFLEVLGHYFIRTRAVNQVMVMTTILMELVHT